MSQLRLDIFEESPVLSGLSGLSGPATAAAPVLIRPSLFSWVYLIYAFVGLFILCDLIFLGSYFRWTLPDSAEEFPVYLAFIGTPHVISGIFSSFDGEYVRFYRRPLLIYALVFIPLLCIPGHEALRLFLFANVLWTVYHHISQSSGICRMLLGRTGQSGFVGWKWSLIATYLLLMPLSKYSVWGMGPVSVPGALVAAAFVAHLYFTWKLRLHQAGRLCQLQITLTSLSVVALPFLAVSTYAFFYSVCARGVHDLSAHVFYAVHDQNRNGEKPGANWVYRIFSRVPVPIYILCPLLGVGLGALSLPLLNSEIGMRFLLGLGFFHYFMEGWTWKKGSLHRRQIAFS